MNQPEPLAFATAHHALRDIETKLKPWREELSAWSSVIVAEFCRHLQDLPIPDGYTFELYCAMDQIPAGGSSRPIAQSKPVDSLEAARDNPMPPQW